MPLELRTLESDEEVEEEEVGADDGAEFSFSFDDGSGATAPRQPGAATTTTKKVVNPATEAREPGEEDEVKELGISEDAAGRERRKAKAGAVRAAHEVADDAAIAAGVFEEVVTDDKRALSFDELELSRPLLRAVAALGFTQPTPVQERVIPLALAGRDVCASAATGSGKTAAFALPSLEKILQRRHGVEGGRSATRCVVVLPTRELAAQCAAVFRDLAIFADDVRVVLICGGEKDVRRQEVQLRDRPDVVVATPGRLVDHIQNAHSVHFDDVEIAILDEADRLLDLGFEDELAEVLKALPGGRERLETQVGTGCGRRQSLLFSATLGARVDSLARLSLRRPIRVRLEAGHGAGGVAARLTQDFVKLKESSGGGGASEAAEREASLVAVLAASSTTLTAAERHRTVCFFDQKAHVARFAMVMEALRHNGFQGLPAVAELHGGLRQADRLANLAKFERGEVSCLLCTDVAARGLDVSGVSAVVNAEMPRSVATYVHRVGRTARAGRSGLAVTLVGLQRRAILKELVRTRQADLDASADAVALKALSGDLRSRTINAATLAKIRGQIADAERDITFLERRRREGVEMDHVETEANRAANVLMYADEIAARPKREWFQSSTAKKDLKQAMKDEAAAAEDLANDRRAAANDKTHEDDGNETKKLKAFEADHGRDPKKPHRLTRAKRRRLEALEAHHTAADSDDDDDPEDDDRKKPTLKERKRHLETTRFDFEGARAKDGVKLKAFAKSHKRTHREKVDDADKIAGEVERDKNPAAKKPKKRAPVDDDEAFDDEKKPRPAPTTRTFVDFDPNRVRAHKKKPARSKTRHKRK